MDKETKINKGGGQKARGRQDNIFILTMPFFEGWVYLTTCLDHNSSVLLWHNPQHLSCEPPSQSSQPFSLNYQ